jgi:hypothetical protein
VSDATQLARVETGEVARHQPTTAEILEAAVRGGITGENVAVVKEIILMQREDKAIKNKEMFVQAFFRLKQEIRTMDFYADKSAKMEGGGVAYTYCSEREIQSRLEPVMFKHGFDWLFGQRVEGEKTVVIITLMHEGGHSEDREYAVRSGGTNRMKDATAADTGATTSAWRHLVIKMFGLKSRISELNDARNLGATISKEVAEKTQDRVKLINFNEVSFLKMAGVITTSPCLADYQKINSVKYEVVDEMLCRKERAGR